MATNIKYDSHMSDLRQYRKIALQKLYNSSKINDLISSVDPDSPSGKDLVFTNIFPYAFVPDTTTSAKLFITMDVTIPKIKTRTYKGLILTLYIFAHQDILKYKDGLLCDLIAEEVDTLFGGSGDFGTGMLELSTVTDFSPVSRFYGVVVQYEAEEFNRPAKMK